MKNRHFNSTLGTNFERRAVNKKVARVLRWLILSVAVASLFLSLSLLVLATTPSSWAQCGADSSIDCYGGARCTATDQVGCACYDSAGKVVDKHSCKEAAPDDGCYVIEEYAY